ncbi:hypothetical protein [Pseudooctadecabacter jejudonensis]|uniref:Uncharacterized protein n=1 Tax=Pseudooctadecabacter jejudonensis TaxID=1391910 RepID=A0A1Y5SJF9_9RHOB|nr:hypothetical protein [Pseudooctadecabacter jejudonensis]SLN42280.1 hypothetical protein PSJ8397_02146 [Pseudooctadecabacter jejudonensis]
MTTTVTLIAVGDSAEGMGLRAVAEGMGYDVRLMRPTSPEAVRDALIAGAAHDVTILSAKGGPRGLYLGDGGAAVLDPSMMDGPWLITAKLFAGLTFPSDSVLISTASATRESGLAAAVFDTGGHLVGPLGAPDPRVIIPWVAACLLSADKGLPEAVTAANALVGADDRFSYG